MTDDLGPDDGAPTVPVAPVLGVSAVIVDADELLLVKRAHAPFAGLWALPGGRVEAGEVLAEAVVREVAEETGVEGACGEMLGVVEVVEPEHHVVVLVHRVALLSRAEPVAGDDAAAARWIPLGDVAELPLADGVAELLYEQGVIATIS